MEVCKKLDTSKMITNYYMETNKSSKKNTLEYLYKMKKGISTVKGGLNVLYAMNYPDEIIKNTMV
jgi:DNA mismatch repair ATPase MutS